MKWSAYGISETEWGGYMKFRKTTKALAALNCRSLIVLTATLALAGCGISEAYDGLLETGCSEKLS